MASPKGNMAQSARKSLTPQDEAMKALRSFEEALKTLESACCLYTELTQILEIHTMITYSHIDGSCSELTKVRKEC